MTSTVHTPLVQKEWEEWLRPHHDKAYSQYLLQGLGNGFRIGFKYTEATCVKARSNMKSAVLNPSVVDEYLDKEIKHGRVLGPFNPEDYPSVQVSRFGVIPKNHQPGKWRLIVDLSHPAGSSVNDGIEPELCSLKYTTVDEAVEMVVSEGHGSLMAKFDIESAYRIIPVHPEDRALLGMVWRDQLFIDLALPFGLRSAPKIFNAVADALAWGLSAGRGIRMLHYLDDFFIVGKAGSCERDLTEALSCCSKLGVPVASHKTEGPTSNLVFLGIQLDAARRQMSLPTGKLQRLKGEIQAWASKKSCSKRELLSLIGQLQHACCIVKPGRSFLRRMITLSTVAKQLHHRIRLNRAFRSDLRWWAQFLPIWNGTGMMSAVARCGFTATLTSDASGSWGCGAYSSSGDWFQLEWPESWKDLHITIKELLPVVLGIAVWGERWKGGAILCRCDNAAVVAIIRSGSSKNERAMHLMRSLSFLAAGRNLSIIGVHIPGVENGAADALSRNNYRSFFSQVKGAKATPTTLPAELLDVLVQRQQDWTSVNWTQLLSCISQKVWPSQHREHTSQARIDT